MAILVCLLIYGVFGAGALRAYQIVRPFRIESPDRAALYRGSPWQWFGAVLSPRNYSPEGQRPLRWFWMWMALFQCGLLVVLAILAITYP